VFDVAPLPHGPGGQSAGTVGGWQLGVSAYSKNQDASIEFVRYMTGPEVQTWRAVVGSFVPTQEAVSSDPQVLEAMPFLKNLSSVVRVTRPSRETGLDYNEVSTNIFQEINTILKGGDAAAGVKNIEDLITPLIPTQ
jgi:trehalose/maltose transport system substrate-binding protein